MDVLVCEIDGQRFALPARDTVEVLRAVAIRPLPGAAGAVEGLVDLRGRVVPVLDARAFWGLPPKPLTASEHLLVAQAGERLIALRVDRAVELLSLEPAQLTGASELQAAVGGETGTSVGVAKLPDGLLLLQDPRVLLGRAGPAALVEAGQGG